MKRLLHFIFSVFACIFKLSRGLNYCSSDADCTTYFYPRCIFNSCTQPTSQSDCTKFEGYFVNLNATTNICVNCLSNSECPSGYTCLTISPTLRRCYPNCIVNSDCAAYPLLPVCAQNSYNIYQSNCVECNPVNTSCYNCELTGFCSDLQSSCPAGDTMAIQIRPVTTDTLFGCSSTNGEPLQCYVNGDCPSNNPQCGAFGACMQCANDSDCPNREASKCVSGGCQPCAGPSNCAHFLTNTFCNLTMGGVCVQCLSDANCNASAPFCQSGTCVQCYSDSDCSNVEYGQCDSSTNLCIPCSTKGNCAHFSGAQYCSTTSVCVQCLTNAECMSPSLSKCFNGACSVCRVNTDCSLLPSTPVCNPTLHRCVQCQFNSDCPGAANTVFCVSNNTCVGCYQTCATCTNYSSNGCRTCNQGYYQNGTVCETCDSSCQGCIGPLNTDCLGCQPNYYSQPGGNTIVTCLSTCPMGFYETNSETCKEICGDGLNFGYYQCDDGNLINGDGCSSVCSIESGWFCFGGNASRADKCFPYNPGSNIYFESYRVLYTYTEYIIFFTGDMYVYGYMGNITSVSVIYNGEQMVQSAAFTYLGDISNSKKTAYQVDVTFNGEIQSEFDVVFTIHDLNSIASTDGSTLANYETSVTQPYYTPVVEQQAVLAESLIPTFTALTGATIGLMFISLWHGESGFGFILLTDILQKMSHMIFLAVNVPDNLLAFANALSYTRIQFLTTAVDTILPGLPFSASPAFANAELTDNFILNTSGPWIVFLSIFFLRMLFGFFTGGSMDSDFIRIYKKAYLTIPTYGFMYCFLSFTIFGLLQMSDVTHELFFNTLGAICAITTLFLVTLFLVSNFLFLHAYKDTLLTNNNLQKYEVLYHPLKINNAHSLNHICYIHGQKFLYSLIVVNFSSHNIGQSLLLFFLHLGMFGFILYARPFKYERLQWTNTIENGALTAIYLFLTIIASSSNLAPETAFMLGWITILIILVIVMIRALASLGDGFKAMLTRKPKPVEPEEDEPMQKRFEEVDIRKKRKASRGLAKVKGNGKGQDFDDSSSDIMGGIPFGHSLSPTRSRFTEDVPTSIDSPGKKGGLVVPGNAADLNSERKVTFTNIGPSGFYDGLSTNYPTRALQKVALNDTNEINNGNGTDGMKNGEYLNEAPQFPSPAKRR